MEIEITDEILQNQISLKNDDVPLSEVKLPLKQVQNICQKWRIPIGELVFKNYVFIDKSSVLLYQYSFTIGNKLLQLIRNTKEFKRRKHEVEQSEFKQAYKYLGCSEIQFWCLIFLIIKFREEMPAIDNKHAIKKYNNDIKGFQELIALLYSPKLSSITITKDALASTKLAFKEFPGLQEQLQTCIINYFKQTEQFFDIGFTPKSHWEGLLKIKTVRHNPFFIYLVKSLELYFKEELKFKSFVQIAGPLISQFFEGYLITEQEFNENLGKLRSKNPYTNYNAYLNAMFRINL